MSETNDQNKAEFLQEILRTRKAFDKVLRTVLERVEIQTRIAKVWRIKDIVAHISWYDNEMVDLLEEKALRGSEYWLLGLENRNSNIFKQYYDHDENQLLENLRTTFNRLITLLRSLKESALNEAKYFAEMPIDWKPWQVIASNTNEHYTSHTLQLNRFLENLH